MGNIVWLASYPKSGNTWVRAFLANLLANRSTPLRPDEFAAYADDEALPERYSELAGKPSEQLGVDEIAALRPQVHALIAERSQGTTLVKSHNMAGAVDGWPLYNWRVTAGAIYVVRNPLDVAVSMKHHFDLTQDQVIERLGNEDTATANETLFVGQILSSWSRHVQSWTDVADSLGRNVVVVRYEDMLSRPTKTFTRIGKLLGFVHDRNRIERAIRHSTFNTLASQERRDGFVEAVNDRTPFFRKGTANQWRTCLTRKQVERIVLDHGAHMARFGYLPVGF